MDTTLADEKEKYKKNASVSNTIDENGNAVDDNITAATTAAFDTMLPELTRIMEMIFVGSWESMLQTKGKSDLDNKIAATIQKFKTLKATEQTAMEIDNEPAADPKTLRNIVESEIASSSKTLEKRLQRLEQSIHRNGSAKNKRRGASPKNGALSKKKLTEENNSQTIKDNNRRNKNKHNSKQSNKQNTPSPKRNVRGRSTSPQQNRKQTNKKPSNRQREQAVDDDNASSGKNVSKPRTNSPASKRRGKNKGNKNTQQ